MTVRADWRPEISCSIWRNTFVTSERSMASPSIIGPASSSRCSVPRSSGKTTTLRLIGGFELPTAGRIELRGRDVTLDPPAKRPVNMVFQNYALFPHLDVGTTSRSG